MLNGERRVLELIATGAPLPDVLDALCRVIDEQSGQMSSVYLLERDGRHLIFSAGPDVPEVWREATRAFAATPANTGVHARAQVVVPDMLTSPLYADWGDAVRAAGFASVWSTPFCSKDGDPLGTFAVYSRESRRPDAAQLELVDRCENQLERDFTAVLGAARNDQTATKKCFRVRTMAAGMMDAIFPGVSDDCPRIKEVARCWAGLHTSPQSFVEGSGVRGNLGHGGSTAISFVRCLTLFQSGSTFQAKYSQSGPSPCPSPYLQISSPRRHGVAEKAIPQIKLRRFFAIAMPIMNDF